MSDVLQAQCLKNVVVEERGADGSVSKSELSTALQLKKEIGNARLVSDDAMLWVAHGSMHSKPVASDGNSSQHHVTVSNGKRSFSFFLESNPDSDSFLNELRAQVDGAVGVEAKRKKRKIRKQIADNQSAGFVPMVNSLKSPIKQPPLTPVKRRLSDSTNSPRLAPPLPMSVSTVSEAHGVFPSPSKSPFRSPFRKNPTPPPRRASPIVSLSLPPKSPAVHSSATPSPSTQTSASTPSLSSPRPREWLSPARGGGGAARVRVQLTPPSVRRDGSRTPATGSSRDGSEKENTPVRAGGGGIVNKRVRSLARMLDDVPREEPENTAGARPPTVRSPYFLSPPNARELSPSRRPSPGKTRSPSLPLGELQQNRTPPLRPQPNATVTPPTLPTGNSTTPGSSAAASAGVVPRKVTHGLLNLGNYCYMNAIIQSLAAIPGFADHLQKDEWLVDLVNKRLAAKGHDVKTLQLKALLSQWKDADVANRLVVQDKLAQLLQQVIEGSETSINPEPLKAVMGRKNSRFASLLQQDAHEFLLHLVTEYEKELVQAVEGVIQKATEDKPTATVSSQPPATPEQPAPAPKRATLYNFFRAESAPAPVVAAPAPVPSASSETVEEASSQLSTSDKDELVAELFPAECFRTELYRTLTCRSCQYSRRQVEEFYDFSLDLPFVAHPKPSTGGEPQPEPPQQSTSSAKQCHCGVDAAEISVGGSRFYSCAKSACSLREEINSTTLPVVVEEKPVEATTPLQEPIRPLASSLHLADLLKEQFKSEVLELTCEKCKEGREATASYGVKSLPRVLVFHLKRFEVNPMTGSLYKRCDLVEAPVDLFPVQNINGSETTSSNDDTELLDARYSVKSVVHHLGKTIDQGHYVADVCGPRGDWRRRNDTHETLIGEDFALRASRSQESCYMMFYVLATPTTTEGGDKENVSAPGSPVATTPVTVASTASTPVESPISLVGRRRENTPPRKNESTVSKSLHDLL